MPISKKKSSIRSRFLVFSLRGTFQTFGAGNYKNRNSHIVTSDCKKSSEKFYKFQVDLREANIIFTPVCGVSPIATSRLVEEYNEYLSQMEVNNRITLVCWVPAPSGVEGIEAEDKVANGKFYDHYVWTR